MERMTHRSSAHWATCGKSSEMGIPDWPCCLNFQGEPKRDLSCTRWVAGIFFEIDSGQGCESSLLSAGLGSKVSTWETPPPMKRTMTDLAVALKCGDASDSAAKSFSSLMSDASASEPIPMPARLSICRRE